ncbi:MAG TPA: FHA domain-containing protein [Anaerolineales bacterium]|nr:FHA domain-containing protein [Anaerolineales bacterium]
MSKSRFIVPVVFVWLASLGLPWVAWAQTTGPTVHIHDVEPPQSVTPQTGGLPGLFLRATFSLLDDKGSVMKSDIENATLRLAGDTYTSKFSKLEDDQPVVLLVDTSGTMSVGSAFNDFRTLRDSVTRALGSAPQGASFALIPFSDRAPTAVEFTTDKDRLGKALKALRPEYGKQACLNDALYEAIDKLSNAPGRRAVIAVTASADSCATRSQEMVVDFAKQNNVELYAVGVDGYTTTSQELEGFTQPTGGLSEMRTVAEANFALDNLIGVLGNQWQAVWVVYPSEGPQTAELDVKLPDATVASGSLAFVSDRTYERPPTVEVAGTAQSTLGGVRFNLDLINQETIAAVDVDLVSKLTGRSVYQERVTELTDHILIPPQGLVQGGDYSLTLTTLDAQGNVLFAAPPVEFRYEPAQPSIAARVDQWPSATVPFFVVSANVQNLEGVAKYRLWLEQQEGSAPVRGTEVTVPAGEPLRLPVNGVRSGNYILRVQALDAADQVLVDSGDLKVAYRAPSAVARLVATLQGSTFAVVGVCGLGALAIVGLGALVVFLIPRGRGMKNVELALPEKGRRQARPAGPATPPASPAPPPKEAVSPRPVAEAKPAPVSQPRPAAAPPAPAEPKPGVQPRPAAASPAQAGPKPAAQARPAPEQPAPVEPRPASAQAPRPSPGPAAAPPAQAAAAPRPSGVLAEVSMAEPGIAAFHSEIRKSPYRIGRGTDNDAVLPVDRTSGVSGNHCVLAFADGRWSVQDDKSTFGTTVNGETIPKGVPFPLEDGAVIGLGPRVRIRFQVVSGSSQGAPS